MSATAFTFKFAGANRLNHFTARYLYRQCGEHEQHADAPDNRQGGPITSRQCLVLAGHTIVRHQSVSLVQLRIAMSKQTETERTLECNDFVRQVASKLVHIIGTRH